MVQDRITTALAALDADIERAEAVAASARQEAERAEAEVDHLKLKRTHALDFLSTAGLLEPEPMSEPAEPEAAPAPARQAEDTSGAGQAEFVKSIIESHDLDVFTTKRVIDLVYAAGRTDLTRLQISNAITYLRRKKVIRKAPGPRGTWQRIKPGGLVPVPLSLNADGPAEAGPSDEAPPPLAPEVAAG